MCSWLGETQVRAARPRTGVFSSFRIFVAPPLKDRPNRPACRQFADWSPEVHQLLENTPVTQVR